MIKNNKMILLLFLSVFLLSAVKAADKELNSIPTHAALTQPRKEYAPVLDERNLEYSHNKKIFAFQTSSDSFEEYADVFEDKIINWTSVYFTDTSILVKNKTHPIHCYVYSKRISSNNNHNFDRLFIKIKFNDAVPLAYFIESNSAVASVNCCPYPIIKLENQTAFNFIKYNYISNKVELAEEIKFSDTVGLRHYQAIPYAQAKIHLLESIKSTLPTNIIVGKKLYLQERESLVRYEWEILQWKCYAKDRNVFSLMQAAQPTALKQILPYRQKVEEEDEKDYINYNFPSMEGKSIVSYALSSTVTFGNVWAMTVKKGYAVQSLFKNSDSSNKNFADIIFK